MDILRQLGQANFRNYDMIGCAFVDSTDVNFDGILDTLSHGSLAKKPKFLLSCSPGQSLDKLHTDIPEHVTFLKLKRKSKYA